MSLKNAKAVTAIGSDGRKVRGIYRREVGTFEAKRGVIKKTFPEYEYSFDFKVGPKRYRSVFGRESEYGRLGATGKWESLAVARAVETLERFKANAQRGEGPTSIKEEMEMARRVAEESRLQEERDKTVEQLVESFLADISVSKPNIRSNKPRTIEEYRLNLMRDLVPALGKRKAKAVERRDIAEVIDKIVQRGAIVQSNRTLAASSRLFNWAVSKGFVPYNPCAQMKKYTESPRKRVLTEPEQKEPGTGEAKHEEIKLLWMELSKRTDRDEARILMLCILTGARPGEICSMRWEKIDSANWWTIEEGETKTDAKLDCFLTPTARSVIGERRENSPFVFSMKTDNERHLPEERLSKFIREENHFFGLPAWQPRDLRRTFTTLATGMDYDFKDVVINKAQARKDGSIIRKHYDKRRYYAELRHLFESIEREILRITGQLNEPAKIIQLLSS